MMKKIMPVIVCSALFYDVVIIDNPDYEDTMRSDHIEWLKSMGQVSFLLDKLDNIIAKVKITRSNPGNPPSDFLLSKWLLKKDIDDRECEMYLDIWYNENRQLREGEFRNIIDKFPDNPF